MKKAVFTSLFLLVQILTFGQTYANKEWQVPSGNPLGLKWSSSITNSSSEIISVGNSFVVGQGANVLTTKIDKDGNILWQSSFNSAGNYNDYGISLTEDNLGNVIVVGTVENSLTSNSDIIVLKYDNT